MNALLVQTNAGKAEIIDFRIPRDLKCHLNFKQLVAGMFDVYLF